MSAERFTKTGKIITTNPLKNNTMRQRKQMPVRSKFKPTESKVETTKQSIVRKYIDLFGCDVKTAHQMYRDFIFKTQMTKPELYGI